MQSSPAEQWEAITAHSRGNETAEQWEATRLCQYIKDSEGPHGGIPATLASAQAFSTQTTTSARLQ